MSGSIEQRTKGQSNQVSNGPSSRENEFEYMQAAHASQGYGSAQMSSPNVTDPYYYPQYMFPNPNHSGLNDGTSWSTGDPMSFLGGYPGQMGGDYVSSNMFGFDYSQPNFGWGYSGGDYNSTWGTSSQVRKSDDRGAYQDNYSYMAQHDYVNGEVGDRGDNGVKAVEHGLKSISLGDRQDGRDSRQTGAGGSSSGGGSGGGSGSAQQRTWASIAKQPARPQPQVKPKVIPRAPVLPNRHNMDIGTWDNKNSANKPVGQPARQAWGAARPSRPTAGPYAQGAVPAMTSAAAPPINNSSSPGIISGPSPSSAPANGTSNNVNSAGVVIAHPVLDKLRAANQYNPKNFNMNPENVRFFIIKSYSEDDIHRSIKYGIWCSTDHGNKRLDQAYREREGKGPLYLLYSVNGSGHFCGMSQMMSPVDYNSSSGVWAQDKWKGQFEVKWIYVKDVPNSQLRHIRLENNENKPVTNSRDTQEVPPEKGKQVLRIIHQYRHTTSIFDDFSHYEKRQEEDVQKDEPEAQRGEAQRNNRRGDRGGDRERGGDRDQGDRGDRRDRRDRGDRGDRGVTDRGDRSVTDRGDRSVTDRGDRGVTDRGDRGVTDRGDRGVTDRGERGDMDRDQDRRRPRNLQH